MPSLRHSRFIEPALNGLFCMAAYTADRSGKRYMCKCLFTIGVVFVSLMLAGCGNSSDKPSQPSSDLPSYELVQDKSFSDATVTKVIWDIVVPKTVTKQSLTALLNALYEKEKAEHSDAAVISIYAYADKEHEEEGMGRWLAWLMTNNGGSCVITARRR